MLREASGRTQSLHVSEPVLWLLLCCRTTTSIMFQKIGNDGLVDGLPDSFPDRTLLPLARPLCSSEKLRNVRLHS